MPEQEKDLNKDILDSSVTPSSKTSSNPEKDHSVKSSKTDTTEDAEVLQAMEQMPEPAKKIFQMQMALLQTSSKRMAGHPLFEKFTPQHIDKFLDYTQKDDDNEYRLKSTNRWFNLTYAVLGVGALLFLIVFLLPKDKELLTEFLKLLIVFASGVGSGYGLKSYQEKKR